MKPDWRSVAMILMAMSIITQAAMVVDLSRKLMAAQFALTFDCVGKR